MTNAWQVRGDRVGYLQPTRASHGETHMRWHDVARVFHEEHLPLIRSARELQDAARRVSRILATGADYGGWTLERARASLTEALAASGDPGSRRELDERLERRRHAALGLERTPLEREEERKP